MGLLTTQQKIALAACIAAFAFLMGGTAAWFWQDNKFTAQLATQAERHSKALDSINETSRQAEQAAFAEAEQLRAVLASTSKQLYEAYVNAKADADKFAGDVATGDERLSIPVTNCPNPVKLPTSPGAGSVVHDPVRADIDPRVAARIVALTNRGDAAIRALGACQAWANKVSEGRRNN